MSEITTRGPPAPVLPALPPREPTLSPILAGLAERMANPHPDIGTRGMILPLFLRAEAEAALARYEQLLLPAPEGIVMDWLTGVSLGMNQPLTAKELASRATEIIPALITLPGGVFTSGTRQEAQITFDWFPGIKDLHALLWRHARPVLARRTALQTLLATHEPVIAPPVSNEERAEILNNFRPKIEAALPVRTAEPAAVVGPRPRYKTDAQLLATYQAEIDRDPTSLAASAARARMEMLTAKLKRDS